MITGILNLQKEDEITEQKMRLSSLVNVLKAFYALLEDIEST
jgi:hypothetical protein